MRGAAGGLQHRPHGLQRGHAKVGDLDVVLLVQEEVLRLQVAVTAKGEKMNLRLVPHATSFPVFPKEKGRLGSSKPKPRFLSVRN